MAVEVSSTRNLLGHFDVPEKLEAIEIPDFWVVNLVRNGNHTAEQVVAKLRDVVYARKMSVVVDRLRKARNQKVMISCPSVEDAKKIEDRLKMRRTDLKVSKLERKLPTMVIRDVLKANTDEDIVRSLRTQNRHVADGLDWEKERAKVFYRRRARNDL
ncbi:hypothetical protein EVAR_99540_1 [Eumeta japonica]|uniref:Uncharacterized protein n=1 Tax=Eumeta variegata TaxID=151549 RepID=A0A4C1ZIY2_EUMVA|nr:hypothetical protein EVAR_99540_1 [Eumeta japonica]